MRIFISIATPLAVGFIGSIITRSEMGSWYRALERPSIAPPDWIFGPVWTTLYLLMGVAVYLVWRAGLRDTRIRTALILFAIQLVLNLLWSFVFFKFHALGLALIEIIVLWVAIGATIVAFSKISRVAALLLVPYLAWVTFATYLTYQFWLLN